jgi:hypothetical protein
VLAVFNRHYEEPVDALCWQLVEMILMRPLGSGGREVRLDSRSGIAGVTLSCLQSVLSWASEAAGKRVDEAQLLDPAVAASCVTAAASAAGVKLQTASLASAKDPRERWQLILQAARELGVAVFHSASQLAEGKEGKESLTACQPAEVKLDRGPSPLLLVTQLCLAAQGCKECSLQGLLIRAGKVEDALAGRSAASDSRGGCLTSQPVSQAFDCCAITGDAKESAALAARDSAPAKGLCGLRVALKRAMRAMRAQVTARAPLLLKLSPSPCRGLALRLED